MKVVLLGICLFVFSFLQADVGAETQGVEEKKPTNSKYVSLSIPFHAPKKEETPVEPVQDEASIEIVVLEESPPLEEAQPEPIQATPSQKIRSSRFADILITTVTVAVIFVSAVFGTN